MRVYQTVVQQQSIQCCHGNVLREVLSSRWSYSCFQASRHNTSTFIGKKRIEKICIKNIRQYAAAVLRPLRYAAHLLTWCLSLHSLMWTYCFAMAGVMVASSRSILLFCRAIDTFDCVQGTMRSIAHPTGSEWVEFNVLWLLFLSLHRLWLLVAGFECLSSILLTVQ